MDYVSVAPDSSHEERGEEGVEEEAAEFLTALVLRALAVSKAAVKQQ